MQRREVYYSGHVQGVGFRYTVRQLAARTSVTGFVRNLPDGRVEMVAEGEPAELNGLMRQIASAMGGYIRNVQQNETPGAGEFDGFEIRI